MDKLPSLNGVQSTSRPHENWIEARRIYMDQAKNVLTPLVYETVYAIHQDAVRLATNPDEVERMFADLLAEARVWALNIINAETQSILQACEWFPCLLKGVIVSNVMVLSSAQLNRANTAPGKVRLTIPPCPVFVQALYTNVASRFFDNPHLFRLGLSAEKSADNKRRANELIHQAIEATVLQLIPMSDVINSSMNFRGNNPIITTRPSVRNRPDPPAAMPSVQRKSTARVSAAVNNIPPPKPKSSVVRKSNAVPRSAAVPKLSSRPKSSVRAESSAAPRSTKSSVGPTRPSLVKKSERPSRISFATTGSMMRPSQFQHHTGSDALKNVLKEIDMETSSEESSFDLESAE